MISITPAVVEKINIILKKKGLEGYGLRIGIRQEGNCKNNYFMGFQKNQTKNDQVFQVDNLRVLIDNSSMESINNLELDYIGGLSKSGFVFRNSDLQKEFPCKSRFSE
jgi:iron-sulfur cluster assembly protein